MQSWSAQWLRPQWYLSFHETFLSLFIERWMGQSNFDHGIEPQAVHHELTRNNAGLRTMVPHEKNGSWRRSMAVAWICASKNQRSDWTRDRPRHCRQYRSFTMLGTISQTCRTCP